MKRIEFIAPVEAMRGNLSGSQSLEYAVNNNPAFEAPNGAQTARNYQPRYIGAKISKSGLKIFGVRRKNTAVLNTQTRLTMALTGSVAAIKSAVMKIKDAPTILDAWDFIQKCYAKYKENNPSAADAKSINTYFDARVRRMLISRSTSYTFQEQGVAGGYQLNNPFTLTGASALVIAAPTFLKFVSVLGNGAEVAQGVYFTIDGVKFYSPGLEQEPATWETIKSWSNPNMVAMVSGITFSENNVQYGGTQVYLDDTAVVKSAAIVADKYSTFAIA